MPTNSNDLGSDNWSADPAFVALTMPGNGVLGALVQNIWSFAGPSNAPVVNKLTLQYFIHHNLGDGWYLITDMIITANWDADSSQRWTVPVGGDIVKLFKIGNFPSFLGLRPVTT